MDDTVYQYNKRLSEPDSFTNVCLRTCQSKLSFQSSYHFYVHRSNDDAFSGNLASKLSYKQMDRPIYYTIFALIIPAVFNPFGTFLLVQVIKTVDSETIEAASLETDKAMTILFRMVVPQIKAGLAAVFIISFADTWNMVEPVLILTKNPELRTLGTAFNDIYAYNSSIAFSGSVIYMLPVVFLYLMFEREIRDSFSVIRLHGH